MSSVRAANYGYSKATSGQDTTFIVDRSRKAAMVSRLRMVLASALIFLFCIIPGAIKGGDANSFEAGLSVTLGYFAVAMIVLFGLSRLFRRRPTKIVITPTTVTTKRGTYALKDARDWRITNPRGESTALIGSGTQAITHDMMVAAGFSIVFSYGQDPVTVANGLSEAQADALLGEITSTIA